MEENLDKLFDYRPLIPGSGRFASIVGIGGGAGRVVDQMHIPADTRSAFPVISVQSPVSIQCCWQS